ncbi:hypothetical protein L6164_008500 [Bauhinia variegata]|uniref:Uncharacterized protein n=1 Tax=Bauhinia variegata TaxID=167791 RepID=A0ACB9PJR1_BAUVA|nr:hypothetical protein L6164_008500 [Bauhinia variegata]
MRMSYLMRFCSRDLEEPRAGRVDREIVDGESNLKGLKARVILEAPEEVTLEYILRFEFLTLNNQAKYEALIVELNMDKEIGTTRIKVRLDSQSVRSGHEMLYAMRRYDFSAMNSPTLFE